VWQAALVALAAWAGCGDGGGRWLDDECAVACHERECGQIGPCPCGTCGEGNACSLAGDCVLQVDCPGECDEMVLVPAGPFVMGSDRDEGWDDERPEHVVQVSTYEIDRFEVTVGRYRRCVEAGACTPVDRAGWCGVSGIQGLVVWRGYFDDPVFEDYPVICLNYRTAGEVCRFEGKRLPTEAEWEKAARGGCEIVGPETCGPEDERIHPWGDEEPDCTLDNLEGCTTMTATNRTIGAPLPVAKYLLVPSPYGAVSLGGNVSEYVADGYRADAYSECSGGCTDPQVPLDLSSGGRVSTVLRGDNSTGTVVDGPGQPAARLALRNRLPLNASAYDSGVRCASSPAVSPPPLHRTTPESRDLLTIRPWSAAESDRATIGGSGCWSGSGVRSRGR
jgi:formylglycine-generating enzyme required for sulfatase activity